MLEMKQKTIVLIVFMISLLVLASCTQNPKDAYLSYIKKSQNLNEYKIVYKMEDSVSKAFGNSETRVGTFKKDKKEKVVAELNLFGISTTSYVYKLNGKTITCTKRNLLGEGDEGINCNRDSGYTSGFGEIETYSSITSNIGANNLTVSYTGRGNIIGRSCDKFEINVNDLSRILNSSDNGLFAGGSMLFKGVRAAMNVCLDRETGLPLDLKIYTKSKSELEDNSKSKGTELISMTVTSLSKSVEDSVFVLPVKFSVMNSACNNSEFVSVIEPYADYNGGVTLNLLDYTSTADNKKIISTLQGGQKNIKDGKIEAIQFSIDNNSYNYEYELCLGNDCQKITCAYGEFTECLKLSSDKTVCESHKDCVYLDSYCSQFSCSEVSQEDNCKSHSNCSWERSSLSGGYIGYCFNKDCYGFKTQSDCENSSLRCKWYVEDDYCSPLY